ncbi:MAG: bifunctional metallophosphatase/5'-nucleotidase [Flavobacteriaceae bacterium]
MKFSKSLFLLFSFLILVSCSKDDGKIEFTFLQVNDVYEIAPIQGGKYGGMARLETVHQDLLAENKNTMLMMAGDFLNPSLLGTMKYQGDRIRGKQMIEVMNAMNFDLVAFGNHEFDLSKNDLQKRMDESIFPWISANVFHKDTDSIKPFVQNNKDLQGSFIKEIADADGTKIKIGFVSVCIPSNPRSYVKYTEMYDAIQKEYESIKDQVDVVFGLTHVKIAQDRKIAELLPNIPLIMGGHEHTHKNEIVGEVMIRKADANAKSAYIHKITFDTKTKKTIVNSELKEITDAIQEEKNVAMVVDKWQTVLKNQISQVVANPNEVIYNAKTPLDGRDTPIRSTQTNLGEIISNSMMFAFKDSDCAIVNGGSIRIDDQLVGDIDGVDIFRVLPYGGPVLKVKMKGSLLKKVIGYGFKAQGTGAYLQRSNNITHYGGKTTLNGKSIISSKIYTVAVSDFLMKGFDIPFLKPDNDGVVSVYKPKDGELAFDIRKSVIEYMKSL